MRNHLHAVAIMMTMFFGFQCVADSYEPSDTEKKRLYNEKKWVDLLQYIANIGYLGDTLKNTDLSYEIRHGLSEISHHCHRRSLICTSEELKDLSYALSGVNYDPFYGRALINFSLALMAFKTGGYSRGKRAFVVLAGTAIDAMIYKFYYSVSYKAAFYYFLKMYTEGPEKAHEYWQAWFGSYVLSAVNGVKLFGDEWGWEQGKTAREYYKTSLDMTLYQEIVTGLSSQTSSP